MGYRVTRGISAPPEVVFDAAIDPDRLARWVPESLRARASQHRLSVRRDQLRVEWQPGGPTGWSGYLQVRDGAAGGAEVEVAAAPAGLPASRPEDVPALLEEALTELDREVVDRLTAG